MPNYNSSGISEEELRTRLVQSLQDLVIAGRISGVYYDAGEDLENAVASQRELPVKRKEDLIENLRRYLTRKVETRDAYVRATTLYQLYTDLFPNGNFFTNPKGREFIEDSRLIEETDLRLVIELLLNEQARKLETSHTLKTP